MRLTYRRSLFLTLLFAAALLTTFCLSTVNAGGNTQPPVRVGMVKSLFRDFPAGMQRMLMIPFGSIMYSQTGIRGNMVLVDDECKLAKQMEKNEVQLGVFHGFEFAWVQEKHPKLKPLMIAVNKECNLFACVITRNDHPAKELTQLKGKDISIPKRSRGHCWLYLERECKKRGSEPEGFFSKVIRHATIGDALDDVVLGRCASVVVDDVSLQCYETVKPGCFNRLRVVQRSPVFPAGVIAYREGHLDANTLKKFRTGMMNAHKDARTRTLLTLCHLTGFEPVPANYQEVLRCIRQTYPASDVRETNPVKRERKGK